MATIEDFFGMYQFRLHGNTNPVTYPPGKPMTISPTENPNVALVSWMAVGQEHHVQVPFDKITQSLSGRNLDGFVGDKVFPVNVVITLGIPSPGPRRLSRPPAEESEEEKIVTGDLWGESAGPLVGQWGAETPPPVETGYAVPQTVAVRVANA
jgi:hypothetical protein